MESLLLFLIPASNYLVANFMFFPFITFKALSLRVLTAIGLLTVKKLTFDFKEKIFLGVFLFFISTFISTVLSISPYRAFWGNAERMEGFISLFFYLILFLILREIFKNKKDALTIFLISFIIFGIIATLDVLPAWIKDPKIRPEGIMGNGAYMGIVGMLTFFISLFCLDWKKESKDLFLKIISILGLIFGLLLLLISQTRSAFLGFLFGISLYAFLKFPKIFKILFLVFLGVFILILAIIPPEKFPLVILSRVSEILHGKIVGSSLTRLLVWKIFLNGWLERPFFGYGPESSPYIFGKFLNPRLLEIEQAIFDRAHNKYVELLATQGIFGFLSYLFLFFSLILAIIKLEKRILPSLLALFGAFFVNNFFIFDIQYTWIVFFGFCAWISSHFHKSPKEFNFILLRPALAVLMIVLSVINFFQIRLVIDNIRNPSLEKFVNSFPKVGPYDAELVVHVGSMFLKELSKMNLNEVSLFYEVVRNQYLKEKSDLRTSSLYMNLSSYIYPSLKDEEKEFVRRQIEFYIKEFPNYPHSVLVALNYFINIKNDPRQAINYLKRKSQEFKFFEKFYPLLKENLKQSGYQDLDLELP